MFVHGGFGHILFNMLSLFFFGRRVESRLGPRRFGILYFVSGIMGALVSVFFAPYAAIIGASGAVFGVMLAFAKFWPRDQILIWGILPVEARVMVIAMTVMAVVFGFTGAQSGVAHFAHLGGFVGGGSPSGTSSGIRTRRSGRPRRHPPSRANRPNPRSTAGAGSGARACMKSIAPSWTGSSTRSAPPGCRACLRATGNSLSDSAPGSN
jgi:hypothetical protein